MSDTNVADASTDAAATASLEGEVGSRDTTAEATTEANTDINSLTEGAGASEGEAEANGGDINPLTAETDDEGSKAADEAGGDTQEKDKPGDGDGEQKAGAPEEYAEFTVPEGSVIDATQLGDFHEVARSMNLDQDQAQALINYESNRLSTNVEAQNARWEGTLSGWIDQAKADKDIGGENYATTVEMGKRALNEFGTPELRSVLDDFGVGNHPEIIRFMGRVGAELSEDTTGGGSSNAETPSLAERLYPSHAGS